MSQGESSSSPGVDAPSTDSSTSEVSEVLSRYQRAWAEGDIETIVAMTPSDGVYEASFGPEPWGQRFVGPEEIRNALEQMGVGQPGRSRHVYGETYVVGDRAFAMWTNVKDGPSGPTVTMHGADFYRVRAGMIVAKIAYRKTVES